MKELSISRDRFPPKKQVVLKVKELFHFLDLIREIQERGDEFRNINLPDYEWEQAGFRDPFTLRAWRETGLAPKDAAQWLEAKFSPARATAWKQAGIEPEVARHWTNADFSEPSDVKAWVRGGFAPDEARVWRDAHLARDTSPLPMELLVQYRRAGFTDADLVYRWAEVLQVPFEAATWSDLGFTPEDAAEWRDVGFTDAYDAAARRKEFLTADEALKNFRG